MVSPLRLPSPLKASAGARKTRSCLLATAFAFCVYFMLLWSSINVAFLQSALWSGRRRVETTMQQQRNLHVALRQPTGEYYWQLKSRETFAPSTESEPYSSPSVLPGAPGFESCSAWRPALRQRFEERCWPWVDHLNRWQQLATDKSRMGSTVFKCERADDCTGMGDRMVGVIGVLSAAIRDKRAVRFRWPALKMFFESCGLPDTYASRWNGTEDFAPSLACPSGSYADTCSKFAIRGACSTLPAISRVMTNMNRPCVVPQLCSKLRAAFPTDLTAADIVGCPMRALFQPKPAFMSRKFWFLHNGERTEQPLTTIEEILSRYYTIVVQIRALDERGSNPMTTAKTSGSKLTLADAENLWKQPFRCAQTVQSYLEGRKHTFRSVLDRALRQSESSAELQEGDDDWLVEGKPVRWLLLTSHGQVKRMASGFLGNRLLQFEHEPKHVSFSNSLDDEAELFAEWYVAGLGDTMVLSDYFYQRPSALTTTALFYNLKHLWYRASTCEVQHVPVFATNIEVPCTANFVSPKALPQPHLKPLRGKFPQAWVQRGVVRVGH